MLPQLTHRIVPHIEMEPNEELLIGGSYCIAKDTPHFQLRARLFENLYWPYGDDTSLRHSKHLLLRKHTLLYDSINLWLRMPRDPQKYNVVYLVDKKNKRLALVRFVFLPNELVVEELDQISDE